MAQISRLLLIGLFLWGVGLGFCLLGLLRREVCSWIHALSVGALHWRGVDVAFGMVWRLMLGWLVVGVKSDVVLVLVHLLGANQLELHALEVKRQQVVQLFCQLKNAAEDQHLALEDCGAVATTGRGVIRIVRKVNLSEGFGHNVELPQVLQFVVLVVLASENVHFTVKDGGAVTGSDARGFWAICAHLLPMKSVVLFGADVALVGSGAIDESSENDETLIVNLGQRVVVSWFWDFTILLEFGPCFFAHIEFVHVLNSVDSGHASVDHNLVSKHSGFMMRDLAWKTSFFLDRLPLDSVIGVVLKLLDTRNAELPHVADGSLLDVPAAMDVEVVVHDETAVVRPSLGQLSTESDFTPLRIPNK